MLCTVAPTENGRAIGDNDRGAAAPGTDDDDQRLVSIGRLAELSGVSSRTIRYYEELEIIPHPPRSPGGTRRYPEDFRFYLEGALALKELGFSLDEIRLLGRLALGQPLSETERAQTSEIVSSNMVRLDRRIRILERLRRVLANEQGNGQQPDEERLKRFAAILRDSDEDGPETSSDGK